MVQQLFSEVQALREEIRYLKGRMNQVSAGGTLIINQSSGGGPSVPAALRGALMRGNATPGWERIEFPNEQDWSLVTGQLLPEWRPGTPAFSRMHTDAAIQKGVLVILSPGNEGRDLDTSTTEADPRVIGVTAHDAEADSDVWVQHLGICTQVQTIGVVSAGDQLQQSETRGLAESNGSTISDAYKLGTMGIAMTGSGGYGGESTVVAFIFPASNSSGGSGVGGPIYIPFGSEAVEGQSLSV